MGRARRPQNIKFIYWVFLSRDPEYTEKRHRRYLRIHWGKQGVYSGYPERTTQ